MPVNLKLTNEPEFYLEADCITPDTFAGKSNEDIAKLKVFEGNKQATLGDYFTITGQSGSDAAGTDITIEGNCELVQRIGEKMSAGSITVKGNVGMHLGNTMSGGKITVEGNAGAWAAAMLDGGEIIINGDAGDHCASAYRGNWIGMQDGKVTVKGRVGVESGSWMRAIRSRNKWPVLKVGSADWYLGVHNHGGTIICENDAEGRVGADMARGQIFINGNIKRPLPTFKKLGETSEIKSPAGTITGNYIEYEGDYAVDAKPKARVYVAK